MTIDLSPEGRKKLRELDQNATKGPWSYRNSMERHLQLIDSDGTEIGPLPYGPSRSVFANWLGNAELITEYRSAVIPLLDALEVAEAQNEKMKAMLKNLEWPGADRCDSSGRCVICGNWPSRGHSTDCALAALLKETQ